MKRICVFCGSSPGGRPEYRAAAEEMAAELVRSNIGLVYGGGNVDATGTACKALRHPGCPGVLHSLAGDARPCGGGAVPQAGEPGAGAGAGFRCGVAASAGGVASGTSREVAGSGDAVKLWRLMLATEFCHHRSGYCTSASIDETGWWPDSVCALLAGLEVLETTP